MYLWHLRDGIGSGNYSEVVAELQDVGILFIFYL